MSAPTTKTYVATYAWLLLLTALEVGVVWMRWPARAVVVVLLATALSKAALIALYFMHLKFDRRLVWWLPGIPVALGALFVAALFPDLVWHLVQRM